MPDLATAILIHLAIGAVIWAFNDPHAYRDFAIRAFVRRTGRVPGNGFVVAAIVVAIVMWPRLMLAAAKALWSAL